MNLELLNKKEYLELIIQTIVLINRYKKNIFSFFKRAGFDPRLMRREEQELKKGIVMSKYAIVRSVFSNIMADTKDWSVEKENLIDQIASFMSYDQLWPQDQFEAMKKVCILRKVFEIDDDITKKISK